MKRFKRLLIPLLTVSLWLVGDLPQAANGKGTALKTEVKTPTPTKTGNTQVVLEQLRAKLENATTPVLSPSTGEQIRQWVMSNGGNWGSSASWQIGNTIGQSAVGGGSSASYGIGGGFWASSSSGGPPGCCALAGDFNHDNSVDISDLTAMVDFMFGGGPPAPCNDEANINGDGSIDISDLTYRVDFMFGGGPAPVCGSSGS